MAETSAPGVIFDRPTAERIEAAVAAVEGVPLTTAGRDGRRVTAQPVVRYAKVTAKNDTTGIHTGEPCLADGTLINAAGAVTVSLRAANPAASPATVQSWFAVNDVVMYLQTKPGEGFILGAGRVPKGTVQYQVLQMLTTSTIGFDWVRTHS